ncbi:MAG: alpha-galactosidase [Clostridia bacterium]|nr:alpha-galactosidase [Clostridia bacterium]
MFSEYTPFYYVNINAETNHVCHSEHPNERAALEELTQDGAKKTVYEIAEHGARITVISEILPGTSTVRQRTRIENKGGEGFVVDTLSALYQIGIGGDEEGFSEGRFVIHYAHSAWQGEAQWRSFPAEELGLYKTYNHGTQTSFRLSSQGTWTTCRYEPVLMIEDKKLCRTWVFTCESGSGWAIDVNVRGSREQLSLAVFVSGSYEKNDGWYARLEPGDSYETCAATVALVKGGFEAAAQELVRYGRAAAKADFPGGVMPLCFNDYMNCIWALPDEKKCRALIDAAADAGCEYYVIDAGWFGRQPDWSTGLGDWNVNDEIFGEGGLGGILRLIESKGMKPGIWLEIESINLGSDYAKAHPDHLLRRHGKVIGGRVGFLDFRIKAVRDHIESVFDRLYGLGVRYIKNDYNQTVGVGIDCGSGKLSPAAELEKMTVEFRSFIDKIRQKYPNLIIENCGSGAMRSDMGTLASFHLQSVSDQEDYFRLPSIIAGLEAFIPPERCGIWTYPYPSPIDDRMTFERGPDFTEKFSDGKNVTFNMTSGLLGLMYLSGRIDMADGRGRALIKEACDIFKENRKTMSEAVPVYPGGTFDMSSGGVVTLGQLNRKEGKLFLAVWNLDGEPRTVTADLSEYASGKIKISRVYPHLEGFAAELNGNELTAKLPGGYTGMFVETDI